MPITRSPVLDRKVAYVDLPLLIWGHWSGFKSERDQDESAMTANTLGRTLIYTTPIFICPKTFINRFIIHIPI